MAKLVHTDVQAAEPWNLRVFLREINIRLRRLTDGVCEAVWDDLRFPVASVNLPGVGGDPSIDATNGTFNFSVNDYVYFQAQMPHGWKEGTHIEPHIHWTKTSNQDGDVNWQLEYKHCARGEVMDASFTTLNNETPIGPTPDTDTDEKHLITKFGDIDMAGREISHMLICKVTRIAATGTEYPADAQVIEIDIHYQSDSRGSAGVGTK
jgi:hypothetical protein